MDDLLDLWARTYDEMLQAGEKHRQLIAGYEADIAKFRESLTDIEAPYRQRLDGLQAEIRPLAEAIGKTYKTAAVEVRYRKGTTRVTYDWRKVDSVRDFLRDVLPETSASLQSARSETNGEASVTVVRV